MTARLSLTYVNIEETFGMVDAERTSEFTLTEKVVECNSRSYRDT